jgi:hypothetical protein
MKKIILGFAFIASVVAVKAQDAAGPAFGIKAGANFANLKASSGDDDESMDMKIGFHVGGFVNIPIGETFAFQPELVYSAEGAKESEDDDELKINLGYINVPLLLQYNASGFFAETGPQVGFLLSAKSKFDIGGDETETDIKDELKGTAFSWVVGLGFKTQSGFGVGARYNLGLSNIVDTDDDDAGKLKSNVIQVSIFKTLGR